tara:strand:- start:262 stop:525 length:264 start_codon:yes stop_codon:yes gene_type:complete
MRTYIYKTIIAVIALIIVFEFTIGKTLNKITSQTDSFFTREGRKETINSIKNEMQKAVKKENFLKQEDRILINNFINKIRNELKNVE